jgi:hypothetical protein
MPRRKEDGVDGGEELGEYRKRITYTLQVHVNRNPAGLARLVFTESFNARAAVSRARE